LDVEDEETLFKNLEFGCERILLRVEVRDFEWNIEI